MTGRDLLDLSLANLRRHRLRVTFTTLGVVIAIATFVALLSFAAGSQQNVDRSFRDLGLLTTMYVYPRDPQPGVPDTTRTRPLDDDAIRAIARIPGVRFAFPFVDLRVTAAIGDTLVTTSARALQDDAFATELFAKALAGYRFSGRAAKEAIVTPEFLALTGMAADSLIGRPLVISLCVASLDSAVVCVARRLPEAVRSGLRSLDTDSLTDDGFRRRLMHRELNTTASTFVEGLFGHQLTVADTFTVIGVGADVKRYNVRLAPVILPAQATRRFSEAGLSLDADPAALLQRLRQGDLFTSSTPGASGNYPQATLDLEAFANPAAVADSVRALGLRAFSYAQEFAEIRRMFLYFYAGLGVIGVLALITAALGIVNTLVMSVTERRKEIGILKSLGADEGEIRSLFLAESAVIGLVGSVFGIICGWLGTRAAAAIMAAVMRREDMPVFDPFALPPWLVVLALAFGIGVSMLAGTYPAGRAARVDPVEALRSE